MRRFGMCSAMVLGLSMLAGHGYAQEIWFAPNSAPGGQRDFMDLFRANAPWQQAASQISIFGLSMELMSRGSDADLIKIGNDLHQRGIGVALDMLPLSGPPGPNIPQCGYHVEGYSSPGETAVVARRMKALGFDPRYYGMDEPLYYGHIYDGPNACHSSIQDIARDVATKVKQVQAVFPGIMVGDSEPFMAFASDKGLSNLEQWFDAYKKEVGQPLAFLAIDMDWKAAWRERLPAFTELLNREGVRLIPIYNGNDTAKSDQEWISQAIDNFKAFEASVAPQPAAVAIQTWVGHPTLLLPDTDPLTLSGLVNQYVAWKQARR
jgi:hypothetical protein